MSTGENTDLTRLIRSSGNVGEVFSAIESYFKKSGNGKTVDRDEDLFKRARAEMNEFILALQSARIQLLFAGVNEPKHVAKQSYYNTRRDYNSTKFATGTASRVSSTPTSSRKQNIGFADDDEQIASDTGMSTPIIVPDLPHEPETPSRQVRTRVISSASKSVASARSVSIGFVDEDPDETDDTTPTETMPQRGTTSMTDEEVEDMSLISDFVESTEDYDISPTIAEFLREAVKSKRAGSDTAMEALSIIRNTRSNPKHRSIEDALGYKNDIIDMPSLIMQWILTKVK